MKGSAGTAGFAAFTPVADALGKAVRDQRVEAISPLLVDISDLVERICLDAPTSPSLSGPSETASISPLDVPPAEVPPSATDPVDSSESMHSMLPTEDPEFCEIVVDFIAKLHVQLEAMQSAFDARQWDELARYAHWLRGSGGTAGFNGFTDPSRQLEAAAKACNTADTAQALALLQAIAKRIVIPEVAASTC